MDFNVAFDWDDGKAASNVKKHGVSFEAAIQVFLDPLRIEAQDDRFDYGEPRFQVMGRVSERILCVAYTIRTSSFGDVVVWIISARLAEARERRWYHNGR